MSPDRLIYMANQIGKFFAAQERANEARAVAGIAAHLTKFWDPRMRRDIIGQVANGQADGLDTLPRRAVEQLADSAAQALGAGSRGCGEKGQPA